MYYKDKDGSLYYYPLQKDIDELNLEFVGNNLPDDKIDKITNKQAKVVLFSHGLYQKVVDMLNALPSPDKEIALIEWENSLFFERDHPLILSMQNKFGLSDDEVDKMFEEGSKI